MHFAVDDEASAFELRGVWEVKSHGIQLVEICLSARRWAPAEGLDSLVTPRPMPPKRISSSSIRSVRVPELERRTRDALRTRAIDEAEYERVLETARAQGFDIAALTEVPQGARRLIKRLRDEEFRPGRQGYSLDLYRWIASEYLALIGAGVRPLLPELAKRASAHLGRPVKPQNARDWVHRARRLGFLTEGLRGRAHADPGPALNTSNSSSESRR